MAAEAMDAGPRLYLVYVEVDGEPDAAALADLTELVPGLYLVESAQTRSRLYHAIKRRLSPQRLLVAPLAEAPKSKGMAAGVQRWLRGQGYG